MRYPLYAIMEMIKGDFHFCSKECLNESHLFDDFPLLVDGTRGEIYLTNDEMWERGYRAFICDGCKNPLNIEMPYAVFLEGEWFGQ